MVNILIFKIYFTFRHIYDGRVNILTIMSISWRLPTLVLLLSCCYIF